MPIWWMPSWLDRVVPRLGIEVDVDDVRVSHDRKKSLDAESI